MGSEKLVLVRHGESTWNSKNLFTGWVDVDLSGKGRDEARRAGRSLVDNRYSFDVAFTSVLRRAIHTLEIILEEMNQNWIEIRRSWRLNERHYGALQGRNKSDVVESYGEKIVEAWRRSFCAAPPKMNIEDRSFPVNDPGYSGLENHGIPLSESLSDVTRRLVPYWSEIIAPSLAMGRRVIVVSHGNTIRAIIRHIGGVDEEGFSKLEIPTGVPVIVELDRDLRCVNSYHLGI